VCETRCGEDGHCRCCLAAEVETLREQLEDAKAVLQTAVNDRDQWKNALAACAEANDLDLGVVDVWREIVAGRKAVTEVVALRAQVAAVRKLLDVWGPREATDATHAMYKELQAALDGPA
jgi:hypothetical protein